MPSTAAAAAGSPPRRGAPESRLAEALRDVFRKLELRDLTPDAMLSRFHRSGGIDRVRIAVERRMKDATDAQRRHTAAASDRFLAAEVPPGAVVPPPQELMRRAQEVVLASVKDRIGRDVDDVTRRGTADWFFRCVRDEVITACTADHPPPAHRTPAPAPSDFDGAKAILASVSRTVARARQGEHAHPNKEKPPVGKTDAAAANGKPRVEDAPGSAAKRNLPGSEAPIPADRKESTTSHQGDRPSSGNTTAEPSRATAAKGDGRVEPARPDKQVKKEPPPNQEEKPDKDYEALADDLLFGESSSDEGDGEEKKDTNPTDPDPPLPSHPSPSNTKPDSAPEPKSESVGTPHTDKPATPTRAPKLPASSSSPAGATKELMGAQPVAKGEKEPVQEAVEPNKSPPSVSSSQPTKMDVEGSAPAKDAQMASEGTTSPAAAADRTDPGKSETEKEGIAGKDVDGKASKKVKTALSSESDDKNVEMATKKEERENIREDESKKSKHVKTASSGEDGDKDVERATKEKEKENEKETGDQDQKIGNEEEMHVDTGDTPTKDTEEHDRKTSKESKDSEDAQTLSDEEKTKRVLDTNLDKEDQSDKAMTEAESEDDLEEQTQSDKGPKRSAAVSTKIEKVQRSSSKPSKDQAEPLAEDGDTPRQRRPSLRALSKLKSTWKAEEGEEDQGSAAEGEEDHARKKRKQVSKSKIDQKSGRSDVAGHPDRKADTGQSLRQTLSSPTRRSLRRSSSRMAHKEETAEWTLSEDATDTETEKKAKTSKAKGKRGGWKKRASETAEKPVESGQRRKVSKEEPVKTQKRKYVKKRRRSSAQDGQTSAQVPPSAAPMDPMNQNRPRGYGDVRSCAPEDFEEQVSVLHSLEMLLEKDCAVPFSEPVDSTEEGCEMYATLIPNPMDLGEIRKRLENSSAEEAYYRNVQEVLEDIELVWWNCKKYNGAFDVVVDACNKCQLELTFLLEQHGIGVARGPSKRRRVSRGGDSSAQIQPEEDESLGDNDGRLVGKSVLIFTSLEKRKKEWFNVNVKSYDSKSKSYELEWADRSKRTRKATFGPDKMYPVYRA